MEASVGLSPEWPKTRQSGGMIGVAFTSSSFSAVDSSVAGVEMGWVVVESLSCSQLGPKPSAAKHVTIWLSA